MSETEYMQVLFKGAEILCSYIVKIQEIEKERFRIAHEAGIMHRKIEITEKIVMERLSAQRMMLEKSIEAAAKELASLGVSREQLITAVSGLSGGIIAAGRTAEERELFLRAIGILEEQINNLREDSMIKYELLSNSILKALEAPLSGLDFQEIGGAG